MRLWHKDLIEGLPAKQLVSQWRECCCIASNIASKGTPNHILVNRIMDYSLSHFYAYSMIVVQEMANRGYKVSPDAYQKFISNLTSADNNVVSQFKEERSYINPDSNKVHIFRCDLFEYWHNNRYLEQCFRNLQEKYDCGSIKEEEWVKFRDTYKRAKTSVKV